MWDLRLCHQLGAQSLLSSQVAYLLRAVESKECPTALIYISKWQLFDNTINKLKQTFINNGYPNKLFDSIVQNYLNKKCTVSSKNIAPPNTHNIYYQNQFSNSYKTDKRIIKQIVKDNT